MSITCDESLIQMYVDGDMGPVEQEIVEAHVKGCRRCRQTLTEYKGLLWDLAHPRPEPAPAELGALSDRLMAAWDDAQAAAAAPAGSTLGWAGAVPGVQTTLATAGRVGRSLPGLGLRGLGYVGRRLLRGGGRR